MDWDPEPKDFADIPDTSSRNLQKQLPSNQALHAVGGATLARKSVKKRADDANYEVIELEEVGEVAPTESTRRKKNSTNVQKTTANLDDITFKDIGTLKEIPCPMRVKRAKRRQLINDYGDAAQGTSLLSNENNVKWRRFKEDFKDVMRNFELWRSSLHEIEGRFGNSVRSYFAFVRWLFLLNIFIFVLIFSFTVIPTIVFEAANTDLSSNTTVAAGCEYNPFDANADIPFTDYIIQLITGTGFVENTLLFVGYYSNSNVEVSGSFSYNIPLSFILIVFAYLLLSLVLLVRRALAGIKESLVSDESLLHLLQHRVLRVGFLYQ